jgi:hypothetical protein
MVAILAAGLTAGCGKKSRGGDLSGKISSEGKPLKGGQIKFQPVAGGVEYPGSIKSDGTYNATGLPAGEMKVAVDTEFLKSMGYRPPGGEKAPAVKSEQEYVPVPPKYRSLDTTPLRVTVSGKVQTKDFDLTP